MQAVDAGVGEDAGDVVGAAFQSADQLRDVGDVAYPPGGEGVGEFVAEADDGEEEVVGPGAGRQLDRHGGQDGDGVLLFAGDGKRAGPFEVDEDVGVVGVVAEGDQRRVGRWKVVGA